jgi:hypothetical protein
LTPPSVADMFVMNISRPLKTALALKIERIVAGSAIAVDQCSLRPSFFSIVVPLAKSSRWSAG